MPLTYASQNLKGRGKVKFAGQSYFNDDGSRTDGAGDGVQRLREQDEDGIDAELLFVPVFASRFLEKIPDRDVVPRDGAGVQRLARRATARSRPTASSATRSCRSRGIDDAIAELERARRDGLQDRAAPQLPERRRRSEARRRPVLGEGARARHGALAAHVVRRRDQHRRPASRHVAVAGRGGDDPARAGLARATRWRR